MSGRNEELLSAYFDGELTDDEKSVVEQLLADDLAAREMLDDVAEVSGWINSLPRPAAPPQLHDQVLSRIRASAAPLRRAAPAAPPAGRAWRRWLAATAAGLLAVVVVYRAWPVPLQSESAARSAGEQHGEELALVRWHDAATSSAPVAENFTTVAFANSGQMLDELARSLESGAPPVPGEVVHDAAQFGDQVLLFHYRVVDTQDLPGQVQLILANNGISTIDNSPAAGQTVADFDADHNGQFEAIYLDAPVTNFNCAVAEITDLDQVTSVLTNSVSFTVPATEVQPPAADAPVETLEQIVERPAAEADASMPEARFRNEAVVESLSDAAVPAPAPAAPATSPLPLGVSQPESALADRADDNRSFGLPANEPRPEVKSLDLYEAAPSDAASVAGESAPVASVEQKVSAFQVAVPVPESLRFKLQENEPLSAEGDAEGRLAEEGWHRQSSAQAGKVQQFWNYSPRPQQGPPSLDRIRAVILLVPQKPDE